MDLLNSLSGATSKSSGLNALCIYCDSDDSEIEHEIKKTLEFKPSLAQSQELQEFKPLVQSQELQEIKPALAQSYLNFERSHCSIDSRANAMSSPSNSAQNNHPPDILYIGLSDMLGTSPSKSECLSSSSATQNLFHNNGNRSNLESHRAAPVLIASDSESDAESSDSDSHGVPMLFTRDSLLLKPNEDEGESSSAESEDARTGASNTRSNTLISLYAFLCS